MKTGIKGGENREREGRVGTGAGDLHRGQPKIETPSGEEDCVHGDKPWKRGRAKDVVTPSYN